MRSEKTTSRRCAVGGHKSFLVAIRKRRATMAGPGSPRNNPGHTEICCQSTVKEMSFRGSNGFLDVHAKLVPFEAKVPVAKRIPKNG